MRDGNAKKSRESEHDIPRFLGLNPVLFSLPLGEDVIPSTILAKHTPVIAIYHTHGTESYLPELRKTKVFEAFSDDMSKTVVRVGEMLAEELQRTYRLPAVHYGPRGGGLKHPNRVHPLMLFSGCIASTCPRYGLRSSWEVVRSRGVSEQGVWHIMVMPGVAQEGFSILMSKRYTSM